MGLISLLRFIVNHPINNGHELRAVFRFLKWQLNSVLNPYSIIYDFTERAKLIVRKGMTGATGNLYCGLHEYNDMLFLLHFLRKEDCFVDIGANIGSYTVLAAAHVGAQTISFEPAPSTYSHLTRNVSVNQINEKVKAYNMALGASVGMINFTTTLDTINHVATKDDKECLEVIVDTLDNMLSFQVPQLIKIDVEGFETEVINGASETLSNEKLKAIIIELNGSGSRYGYSENAIHEKLLSHGFKPFNYNPDNRVLVEAGNLGTHNTIYVRDLPHVEERLKAADKVRIYKKYI